MLTFPDGTSRRRLDTFLIKANNSIVHWRCDDRSLWNIFIFSFEMKISSWIWDCASNIIIINKQLFFVYVFRLLKLKKKIHLKSISSFLIDCLWLLQEFFALFNVSQISYKFNNKWQLAALKNEGKFIFLLSYETCFTYTTHEASTSIG